MTDIHGGMTPNPFGGENRLDHINLMEYLEANAPADKVLFLRIIQDAASNYLYALLGKNGTSVEEFFYTHQYFFKVNSTDRKSWARYRTIKHVSVENGSKLYQKRVLEDNELRLMCFDKQFEMSGLSDYMHIDRFRASLKNKRKKILTNNWEQVISYISTLYQRELNQIAEGQQVPLQVWKEDLLTILVDPPTPKHLASLIYISNKLKKHTKSKQSKLNEGQYSKLAAKLESQIKFHLDPNWGPLSTLLGAEDVQGASNNSSDSILCGPDRCGTPPSTSDSRKALVQD